MLVRYGKTFEDNIQDVAQVKKIPSDEISRQLEDLYDKIRGIIIHDSSSVSIKASVNILLYLFSSTHLCVSRKCMKMIPLWKHSLKLMVEHQLCKETTNRIWIIYAPGMVMRPHLKKLKTKNQYSYLQDFRHSSA